MTQLYTFDDGAFDGWSEVEVGGSTVTAHANYAKRGPFGIQIDTDAAENAYLRIEDIGVSLSLGDWFYLGFWYKHTANPTGGYPYLMGLKASTNNYDSYILLSTSGTIAYRITDDAAAAQTTGYQDVSDGEWHWVVTGVKRHATTGEIRIYIDGSLADSVASLDTDTRFAALSDFRCGSWESSKANTDFYIDDVMLSSTNYPQPPSDSSGGTSTNTDASHKLVF